MNKFWKKNSNIPTVVSPVRDSRQSLAPRMLAEGDPAFKSVEELRYAMSLPECRNIALTGVFGSGKSSVINTYLASEDAPKKVLRISLSNFLDAPVPTGNNPEAQQARTSFENQIEYKIFQQIIYKADYEKTSQSKFKRLAVSNAKTVACIAKHIIIFFICFVILLEPKCLQVSSFYDYYYKIFGRYSDLGNFVADVLAACVMLFQLYHIALKLIPKVHALHVSSIKAKDFEVNFENKDSFFSQLLDEILYYFKAGEYDAVIFEDLDRIAAPQDLFLKLREINTLLNESEFFILHNRTIRFIYAIKDDLFTNEVRTKFFDYIIPIVPVVDSFNASEYMIRNCREILAGIEDVDIKALGTFIPRMRDVLNILNEYQLYRDTIMTSSLSCTKLFAMVIYKNLYPEDYSHLHDKKGCLYTVFNSKDVFSKKQTEELEVQYQQALADTKAANENLEGMRKTVLDVLSKQYNISKLVYAGKTYTLEDCSKSTNSDVYEAFENDRIELCFYEPTDGIEAGYRPYTHKFHELVEIIDEDQVYYDQMEESVDSVKRKDALCHNLDRQISSIRKNNLITFLRLYGTDSKAIIEDICLKAERRPEKDEDVKEIAETIYTLVRNAYITEDYSSYISYTYYGSVHEDDFRFYQAVLQGKELDYDYPLHDVSSFIDGIHTQNYRDRSILNFYIADYLFKRHSALGFEFIKTARQHPDFIVGYDSHPDNRKEFFEQLFHEWGGCISFIQSQADDKLRAELLRIYFRVATQSVPLSNSEKDYVSTKYSFLCRNIANYDYKKLVGYIAYHNLKFQDLISPTTETQKLFDYVCRYSRFAITLSNLLVIYGETFRTQGLTCVLNGSSEVAKYLKNSIETVIEQLPLESKQESEQALLYAVNSEDISDDLLPAFLINQQNKITSLSDVSSSRYQLLLKGSFVLPSWDNVRQYFAHYDELSVIADFINKHAMSWPNEGMKEGDDQLQQLLFGDNSTLTDEAYTILAPCCHYQFEPKEIEGLAENRLEILLDNELLEYSNDYNQFVSKYSPRLFAKYLIKYFNELMAEENEKNFENSNLLGIEILNSTLPVDKKSYFLKEFGCIITTEGYEQGAEDYSRLICEFYHTNGVEEADISNAKLLVGALQNYHEDGSWQTRIELINKIHKVWPSDENRAKLLVDSLGDPYTELNTYATKPTKLHNNDQNRELLHYLKTYCGYISRVIPTDDGQLKVTYKKTK